METLSVSDRFKNFQGLNDGSWGVTNRSSFDSGTVARPGFINWRPDDEGSPCGYSCQKSGDIKWPWNWGPWTKTIWQFDLKYPFPLMYVMVDGTWLMPSSSCFRTDFGSIPPPLRSLPGLSESRFLLSYLFHDCIYGIKDHWIWASLDGGVTWTIKFVNREWTDNLLRECIANEPTPGGVVVRNTIWKAVRTCGSLSWA